MFETKRRTFARTVVSRAIGVVVSWIVSYLLTNSLEGATLFAAIYNGLRIVINYFVERFWLNHIKWGLRFTPPIAEDKAVYAAHDKEEKLGFLH